MRRPIKHDRASKHRKSKALKANIAVHPAVIIAITAALAMVVFLVLVYFFRILK